MKKIISFLFSLIFSIGLFSQSWNQIGSDINGDATGDKFGQSIDMNSAGTRIVVGAPFSGEINNTGEVKVYENIDGTWTQLGSTIGDDLNYEKFGFKVSMSADGNTISVVELGNGTVRVYGYEGSSWIQKGADFIWELDNYFNISTDLSDNGNTIVIGVAEFSTDGLNQGLVGVYEFNSNLNSWTLLANNIVGDSGDKLGCCVSINSTGQIIAIRGSGINNRGIIKTYIINNVIPGSESWFQMGNTLEGTGNDTFLGNSIELDFVGNILVVGTSNYDITQGDNNGKVDVYELALTNEWQLMGSPILPTVESGASEINFGYDVDINEDGSIISVGAPGFVKNAVAVGQVSVYSFDNNNWTKVGGDITGSEEGDQMGFSVSVNSIGDIISASALGHDSNTGMVKAFTSQSLGLKTSSFMGELALYPNPTKGLITIEGINEFVDINIWNIEGRLVQTLEIDSNENIEFEINSKAGYYLIEVITNSSKATFGVIKE